MKKLLGVLALSLITAISALGLTACGSEKAEIPENDGEILTVYNTYVAYAAENGIEPLSYEEWLQTIKGEKGDKGDQGIQGEKGKDGKDGVDGLTPTIEISADGYWVINGTKTAYKAIGTDGKDGVDGETPTIEISADGYWVINGTKTAHKAIGTDGEDGEDGEDGNDGKSAYEIWLNNGNTGSEADFLTWLKGADGQNGAHYGEKYTVNFDANGGELPVNFEQSVSVDYGNTITLPIPTRENFVFEGWYTGTSVNDGKFTSLTPVTTNVKLIAKWKAEQTYQLFFQTNGGNGISARKYDAEEQIFSLPTPAKTDSVFTGWYLDEELKQHVAFPMTLSEDTTVYAQWQAAYYTVNFYTYSSNVMSSLYDVAGTVYNSFSVPQNGDKVFVGWYYDPGFKSAVSFPITLHEDLNIYAKWQETYYSLTFNSNGGTAVASQSYVSGYVLNGLPTPTRDNYRFVSWCTDSNLTKSVSFPYTVSENAILYAKWNYIDPYSGYVKIYDLLGLQSITNLNGKYVLMNDIDCENVEIMMIGNENQPFTGHFNGDGHTISNFSVNVGNNMTNGLFAVNGGVIRNVKFVNMKINFEYQVAAGFGGATTNVCSGGVVGKNTGILSEISVEINLDIQSNGKGSNSSDANIIVGGLCGINSGSITNCSVSGMVSSYFVINYTGATDNNIVGGIVGENGGYISNCLVSASLFSMNSISRGKHRVVAGISGINTSEEEKCLFLGSVSGTNTTALDAICAAESGSSAMCYKPSDIMVSGGTATTVSYLNKKSFYTQTLGWDASIWNLEALDYYNGIYAKLY